MNLSQHIKFWLSKIIYFLLCYAIIVGTYLGLWILTTELIPSKHLFPYGKYNKVDCIIVLMLSSLIISEVCLCLLKNYFNRNKLISFFVVIYLGGAFQCISWFESNYDIGQFIFSSLIITLFSLLIIAIQFLRYQFYFISEKNYIDIIFVLLVFWPFLNMMVNNSYEYVYDIYVFGNNYAELIFMFGVPMFFVYPVLFPSERRKVVSILCSITIMLSFIILYNVEINRFIMIQQINWERLIVKWMQSMRILIVFVAPVMLVPRLLYWLCHRYIWKNKIEKPNNEPLPTH